MKRAIITENMLLVLLAVSITWIITAFLFQNSLMKEKMDELRETSELISSSGEVDSGFLKQLEKSKKLLIEIIAPDKESVYSDVADARRIGYVEKSNISGLFVSENMAVSKQLNNGDVLRISTYTPGGGYTLYSIILALAVALIISIKFAGRFTDSVKFVLHGANLTLERAGNEGGVEVTPEPETLQFEDLSDSAYELARTASVVSNRVKELYIENKRVEYLLDNMREGLVVLHRDLSILLINHSALSFFDVSEDIKGQNVLKLTHTPAVSESLQSVTVTGKPVAIDYKVPGVKTILQILINAVYNEENEINGAIMIISDVTEIRLAEQIRSEFVANASHELKTPLTSIKGFSELIDSGIIEDPEKVHGYLEQICSETERMIGLINDILKLSEIESTVHDTRKVQLSLRMLAEKVTASLENQINAKKITVSVTGDIGNIEGNSDHLQQMLLNLIDNAVKYNVVGGRVDIAIKNTADKVSLSVCDTGVGIPQESQQRVFERFYRVDKSRSRKQGGTGLGLSIVKHIVELYKGTINLKSEVGKGTSITVTLPTKCD